LLLEAALEVRAAFAADVLDQAQSLHKKLLLQEVAGEAFWLALVQGLVREVRTFCFTTGDLWLSRFLV